METTTFAPAVGAEQVGSSPVIEKPRRDAGAPVKWYRCKLSREQMSGLNRKSDLKAWIQTGGFLLILVATGTLFVWTCFHAPYFAPLALLLHGSCCAFQINAVHELVHESVFKTRRLNGFFAGLFSFTGWYNHYAFWTSHAEHHKFTLHPPDDLEVVLPQKHTLGAYLRLAVFDYPAPWYTLKGTFKDAIGRVEGPWARHLYSKVRPEQLKPVRRWAWFLLLGHAALCGVSIATGYWPIAVAVTLGRFFGNGLHFLCNAAQHVGLVDMYPDFRVCCRTIYLSPPLQFLYWNMNFHTEHHMYAGVPCYNLPKLHRAILHEMPACPRGLYRTWSQIVAILKRQKQDPSYQYFPTLPAAGLAGVAGSLPRPTMTIGG